MAPRPTPPSEPVRVLAIDDDEQLCRLLEQSLARESFSVTTVASAETALTRIDTLDPDVLIVDLYLPGMSGLDLLEELRERSVDVPLILLTGEQSEGTRVMGLDLGADDYIVKPFSPRELAARVRAVLRRSKPPATERIVECGDLLVDLGSRVATVGDRAVDLTPKEFDLLVTLARHPGKAHSYEELLQTVWGSKREWQDPATVTEHVRRLRHKLGESTEDSRITTLRGVGYRFDG